MVKRQTQTVRAADLPAADTDVVELLAWLAGVEAEQLAPLLGELWGSAHGTRKALAARRVAAWSHADALRAAARRREIVPKGVGVASAVVDVRAANPRWGVTKACLHVADQHCLAFGTVYRYYSTYKHRVAG